MDFRSCFNTGSEGVWFYADNDDARTSDFHVTPLRLKKIHQRIPFLGEN